MNYYDPVFAAYMVMLGKADIYFDYPDIVVMYKNYKIGHIYFGGMSQFLHQVMAAKSG